MKKLFFLVLFGLLTLVTQGQRFFYVESNAMVEKPFKQSLLKESQYLASTPLMSDYIVKTAIGFQAETNTTTIKITIEDSATFNSIYEAKEAFVLQGVRMNSKRLLNMVIKTMIEENIHQIVFCAKNDHMGSQINWIKPRKDKT
jgi:hypothetical protein